MVRNERPLPALLPEWDRLAVRPDAPSDWQPFLDEGCEARLYSNGTIAAYNDRDEGWEAVMPDCAHAFNQGPETGQAGRDAADAALRKARGMIVAEREAR